jgi:hypothetical protein
MSNRLFSVPRLSQVSLVLAATLSIVGLTACSSGSTSGGSAGDQSSNAGASNPRDLFYHDLKQGNSAQANANGNQGADAGGKPLGVAFCWESRLKEMGAGSILSHSTQFKFKQGDGVRFHFRPNAPCYAYLVLWEGSSGSKDQLLYPANESDNGTANKLEAGKEYAIPANGMLEFDNKAGKEDVGFVLSVNPIPTKKAMELAHSAATVDFENLGTNKVIQSGPMSLFATSDQNVPASDYKTGDRGGDPEHDPFVYVDNSKDPAHGIGIGIPLQHT